MFHVELFFFRVIYVPLEWLELLVGSAFMLDTDGAMRFFSFVSILSLT